MSSREPAVQWLEECFAMTDRVTLVIVDRSRGKGRRKAHQMSRLAGECCTPRALAKLKDLNLQGWDVYCSVNPTVQGSSRAVRDVRRLQVELDTDGDEKLRTLVDDARRGVVPMPSVIVRSSASRWHVLWHAEPEAWTVGGAVEANRRLARAYGGDPADVDVTRVFRLPGFRNCKAGRERALVAMVPRARFDPEGAGRRWVEPSAFRSVGVRGGWSVEVPLVESAAARVGVERPRAAGRPAQYLGGRRLAESQSEVDWRDVVDDLRGGRPPDLVIQDLAAGRSDKSNPRDYAERTVVRACRSLGLEEPETEYGRRNPVAELVR